MNRDKIMGMFMGVAIGDALGKAVETCSAEQIAKNYGRITDYVSNSGHKWFHSDARGTTTDDWQLTAATAEGLMRAGEWNEKRMMDCIAAAHAEAFHKSVAGWGKTTKEAVAKLIKGESWLTSGKTDEPRRGTGNGICMKVAPIGAYMAAKNPKCEEPLWTDSLRLLKKYAQMTHYTRMGVQSGACQAVAIMRCLLSTPKSFNVREFLQSLFSAAGGFSVLKRDDVNEGTDDLEDRLALLSWYNEYTTPQIIEEMGGGSCYIYDSLPFTYMFFVRNPARIESLYECVSAGGDTDTNGSMLASLLGALHGPSIFPSHLVDGLVEKDSVIALANRFSDYLGL